MKTLKTIAILSFILIVFAAEAINPVQSNSANPQPITGNIKYKVVIHVNPSLSVPTSTTFWVVLSDGNGRRIGIQEYVMGVNTYYFSEPGPATGARVARVIIEPHGGAVTPFYCNPDVKYGTFRNGVTYQFNMYPKTSSPD
jgi:hypothetical protein